LEKNVIMLTINISTRTDDKCQHLRKKTGKDTPAGLIEANNIEDKDLNGTIPSLCCVGFKHSAKAVLTGRYDPAKQYP